MKYHIPGVLLVILFICCQPPSTKHVERNGFLMDTVIRISMYDLRSEESLQRLADQVFAYMLSIENNLSAYIEGSDIQQLNDEAGGEFLSISPESEYVLQSALDISDQTGGAFDITVGPLKTLWGFDSDRTRVPDVEEIQAYLSLGNYHQVELKDGLARIQTAGLGIDLGGIAKGYIIDAAVQWLQDAGVRAGLVEGGGDLRVFGPHPKNKFWKIGIQDPRNERGNLIGIVTINNLSVATSGDYERFFIKDGIRYHHILNPKDGFPSRKTVSASVIAPDAMTADAFATAVFVLGVNAGLSLVNSTPDVEALIVAEKEGVMAYHFSEGAHVMIQMMNSANTQ